MLHQASKRKGSLCAICPVNIGDIAIINGVIGLDAGGDAQARKTFKVLRADKLSVFNPAMEVIFFEDVEHGLISLIANGMDSKPKTSFIRRKAPSKTSSSWPPT